MNYVNRLRQAGSWYWNESNTSKIATGTLNAVTYDYDLEKAADDSQDTGPLGLKFSLRILASRRSASHRRNMSMTESQKSTAVTLKRPVISSAVNKKGKKIKITWKKQSGVTGYQIRYKTGKKTKTIKVKKSSTTTKTISGLKKGKTYTITLRSYKNSDGKTIYSAWSKKKKVKVKK